MLGKLSFITFLPLLIEVKSERNINFGKSGENTMVHSE